MVTSRQDSTARRCRNCAQRGTSVRQIAVHCQIRQGTALEHRRQILLQLEIFAVVTVRVLDWAQAHTAKRTSRPFTRVRRRTRTNGHRWHQRLTANLRTHHHQLRPHKPFTRGRDRPDSHFCSRTRARGPARAVVGAASHRRRQDLGQRQNEKTHRHVHDRNYHIQLAGTSTPR